MTDKPAFERLHQKIRQRIHDPDLAWPSLRAIQAEAIHHVLDDRGHLIITAPTAAGKTEAAFLPILSRIADDDHDGVRAIYIGPLKALINDQFRRVESLCERIDVPVHRWHGDVGAAAKRLLLKKAAGVLLITPESLEATLMLRAAAIPSLFGRLRYVVIDELHAFVGTERGAQLRSLLSRLEHATGTSPVRIALSATLGDPERARTWLRPDAPATLSSDDGDGQEIQIRVRGFWKSVVGAGEEDSGDQPTDARVVARAIWSAGRGKTNLVFANAKAHIEELAVALIDEAKALHIPDDVVVHHGSLSKDEREHAEAVLQSGRACTGVCSNTLELGIDIGAIDRVFQVTAPWSVSALRQRLGRSGRRDDAPAVLICVLQAERRRREGPWNGLHLDFLQGVAAIELMLAKYIEPPPYDHRHLSTLVQQTLALLAQTGGITATDLHARLAESHAFGELSAGELGKILRRLGEEGLIEQIPQGELILAPEGERIAGHHTFYAAFQTPRELKVIQGQREIGRIPEEFVPLVGHAFLLAGKKWCVEHVDGERGEILVRPAPAGQKPVFGSSGKGAHRRLHEAMRRLGEGDEVPRYLDAVGREILEDARAYGIAQRAFQRGWVSATPGLQRLYLWAGAPVLRTIELMLRAAGLNVDAETVGLDVHADDSELRGLLAQFAESGADGVRLAMLADEICGARSVDAAKYDHLLPVDVWAERWAAERLAVEDARALAREMLSPTAELASPTG